MSDNEDALMKCCYLVLIFHKAGEWSDADKVIWEEITGSYEATSKVMCNHIRKTILKIRTS